MKKYKELLKNVGLLTLSNFGSKLLGFFLIPLYTAILSTEEYGNFDFINVTISLLIPLLTVNISEGAWRYLLDKNISYNKKKQVCAISLKITLFSIVLIIIFSLLNNYLNLVTILKQYCLYFILYYIFSAFYQFAQNVTRGFDKLQNIAISGIINSVLMLTLNILFLVVFDFKLDGYFFANIIANLVSTIYLFYSIKFSKNLDFKVRDTELQKDMINYSKPLMLNSVGWWVNNVSDRYIVTFMCGIAANGIYSVAYKIPSILSIIQSIFNQAWTVTAIKNINEKDSEKFFNNIYTSYNLIMIICCSILIMMSKILAKFLYLNEFYTAWMYMPFLMISLVFGAMSGLLGGLFSAAKDSKIMGRTTIIGAVINIIGNIILISMIGVNGAAISTAFSYFIVWILRIIHSKKYMNFKINLNKDIFVYLLLVIQAIVMLYVLNNIILYLLQMSLLILEIIIYNNEIIKIIKKIKIKLIKK